MATKAQVPITCEICESDAHVNFYCVSCGLILCKRCKLAHFKIPKTKNDEIISLSEARKKKIFKPVMMLCNDHPTEEISMFCERCEKFICNECLVKNHQGHQLTTTKNKIRAKKDELINVVKKIKNKKEDLKKALDIENNVHTTNSQCYDQIRTDISKHFHTIIKEFTSLRDEKFTELSALQQKENERHSDACTNIQSQSEKLTTVLQSLETEIESGNLDTMETAKNDASKLVQTVLVPSEPMKACTKYKPGNINRPVMMPVIGDMSTKYQGARPKQQQQVEPSTPRPYNVIQCVQARDTTYSIRSIMTVTQNRAWVAAYPDKHLTMINTDGATVKTSVQLCDGDSYVNDVKKYNNDLLVTCWKQHQVIKLSEDGGTKTTFIDVSPYYPLGLCVTQLMHVLLGLKYTTGSKDKDAKVIRIDSNGKTIQSIQYDKKEVIYSWPYRVTSLQSGEVIVCDIDQHMRVACVNSEGHLMFTWSGEIHGIEVDTFTPLCIAHDKFNNLFITDKRNHRVYMLNKDGTKAKCLIKSTQGIQYPFAIAVDDSGQLWVGSYGGKIHILTYNRNHRGYSKFGNPEEEDKLEDGEY